MAMKTSAIIFFISLSAYSSIAQNLNRVICEQVVVEADVDVVWDAWTTTEGINSFFAPGCNIDFRVNGLYEIFFNPDAEPGQRGSEGMRIMAIQPKKMFAFTWNSPPTLPNVRKQQTHVVIRFKHLAEKKTRITLIHDGWGEGREWDKAYAYFSKAWNEVVLPRLKYRFSVKPIDWKNPPYIK